jgi:hypothetical protein
MKEPTYQLRTDANYLTFKFTSIGPKGSIEKIVTYTETDSQNIFNLAFGDRTCEDDFDDLAVSDNGDSVKVLTTVASTLNLFFEKYPEAVVIAAGSTPARTRLYRMGIRRYFQTISNKFAIFGYHAQSGWENFQPDCDYEAFSVSIRLNRTHHERAS